MTRWSKCKNIPRGEWIGPWRLIPEFDDHGSPGRWYRNYIKGCWTGTYKGPEVK